MFYYVLTAFFIKSSICANVFQGISKCEIKEWGNW